jgi:uncharacterized protein
MVAGSRITVDLDVVVEMRDGVRLAADVYRPSGPGRWPVLLQRTPYDKARGQLALLQTDTLRAVRRGYVVVIQDCRGRYASEGDFAPFRQEVADGFDSVEWCAAQPWANGRVGMYGTSYVGAVQWLAAVAAPPSLRCISPTFTASDYHEGWTYQGGALQWGFLCNWVLPYLAPADLDRAARLGTISPDDLEQGRRRLVEAVDSMPETVRMLPTASLADLAVATPYLREWLARPDRNDWWQELSLEGRHHRVAVPSLNVGGWYDIFLGGTLRNFERVRAEGATAQARSGTQLLVGPWTHATPPPGQSGEVDFGLAAGQGVSPYSMDLDGLQLRFFDHWLRDEANGVDGDPPVRLFVMGSDTWRDEEDWPPPDVALEEFFLHSGGSANTSAGDGSLSLSPPRAEPPDRFLYDPRDPVPTAGGGLCCYPAQLPPGAFDQRRVQARRDVLVYTTAPLEDDLEVVGPVTLRLWAATTAPDTDFTAKLVDVGPDGFARNLTDGIVRARYRQGTERPTPVPAGEPIEYVVDLWATANLFRRGHRVALEVSSSNFPRFDRNPNTGTVVSGETDLRTATQTILHDREHPSRLVLPVRRGKA